MASSGSVYIYLGVFNGGNMVLQLVSIGHYWSKGQDGPIVDMGL